MSSHLPAGAPPLAGDFADAGWFPVDLHVPERRYAFLSIDEAMLQRSSFLDTRIEAPLEAAQPVALSEVPLVLPRAAAIGWLFHTSFCGSTLAARALHLSPYSVCLREPLVLRRLGDARYSGWRLDGLIAPTVRLLSRPWAPDGSVVIKPTHAALNVATELMAASPGSRAVILTSSLDDFLISNLKKTGESQAKIPALADRALRMGSFASRLSAAALDPPDLLGVATLQWAAQREIAFDVLQSVGADRVRMLGMDVLLDDLPEAIGRVGRWFGLALPTQQLRAHCADIATRNAKALDSPYSASRRTSEMATIRALYGEPLARARRWAERHVLPVMRSQAVVDPQPW